MQLEIRSFPDAGAIDKERVILRVLEDINIGGYVVLRSKLNDRGGPLSGKKDAYWFPDVQVKRGDLVVLYTKRGTTSKKDIGGNRVAHFYYWRLPTAIWGASSGNTAVLMHAESWDSKSPPVQEQ